MTDRQTFHSQWQIYTYSLEYNTKLLKKWNGMGGKNSFIWLILTHTTVEH